MDGLLPRLLRSKITWGIGIAALLVGLYALAGFYWAPRLVRSQAIDYVRDTYGRELQIGEVRIQPFKLQAEVNDLALPDADGSPMLGFRRLFVDFQVSSLWERAYVFREVTLDAPRVRAVLHTDGTLNLAALVPPEDPEEEDGPPPPVWIQAFSLGDGTIDLLNLLRRHPVERHFSPVSFALRDFRTTPEGGGFGLQARSQQDEVFEWKGRFAVEPEFASTGEFQMSRLLVPGVAEFLGEDIPFLLPKGLADLGGTYDFRYGEALALDVRLPRIAITDAAVRARGVDEDWIEVPSLLISGTHVALPAMTIALDRIDFQGLKARTWKEPDGSLNTDRLFAAPTPDPATAATPTATPAAGSGVAAPPSPKGDPSASAGTDVKLTIGSVGLRNAAIDFEDRTVTPAARFVLAPLEATVREASLDLARPLPVEFRTTINGRGQLAGSGQLVPDTAAIDVGVELSDFPLQALQPYAGGTDLTIQSGTVGAKGRFSTSPPGAGKPELAFDGDVVLTGFGSKDNALEQDFVNFERVDLTKLRFALAPDALGIERVRVVKPFARVIVSSDQVLNVSAVLDPEGTAAALAARKAEAAAQAKGANRKKTRAEERAEKQAAEAAAQARAKEPPPTLVEAGMKIRIREVVVDGGTLDFADYSVQPNFAAAIQAVRGSVTGLSSDPNSRATVKLAGNVGEFSPVDISGTVQPFAYDRYTDIGLKFQNISLPVFNPYSGKFAGYNIAKGKLTTDLHYKIDARKLDAQHKIRIDQLEWGEATAAKGEATLPVKFATSLLKDADGVITLDVPVSGTLDDPTFRIGPIVWQVIKNVLTKAVTAPFKALGALFQGAEEAQFVDFAPGQAVVDATVAGHLAALGKSLASKEDLRLEVPIGVEASTDGAALAQARYERERQAALAATLGGKKRTPDDPALPTFDSLEPERRLEVLRTLYQRLSGAPPELPEPAAAPEGMSRKERKAQELQASLDWLEAECRKRAVAGAGELEQLGQARGEAVQRALLTDTGLPPERVYLVRDGKVTAEGGQVRFELAVK